MLKIKGTDLDRSKKLTDSDIYWCKLMRKEGATYSEIGEVLNVSPTCIRYNLLSSEEKRKASDRHKEFKHNWWYSLSKEKRTELGRKWRDSTTAYKAELIETKINNMCR